MPYGVAYEWQRFLHERRVSDDIPDVALVLQHPHVFTLGRRFRREHLLVSDETLAAGGIEVFEADRGGSVTYHGPGQCVVYPIVDLKRPGAAHPTLGDQPDALRYLRTLEEAIIRTVRGLGVIAGRREGLTGVWVGVEKVASIGVKISKGVAKHGLAINVTTNLEFFDLMIPCGLDHVRMTTLERVLGRQVDFDGVSQAAARNLAGVLHRRPVVSSLREFGLNASGVAADEEAEVIPFPRTG